jgi:hypothetical protein
MASERQIEANRKNAKRSTGPKTRLGKAKSRRNAFCHGLSQPTSADDPTVEALTSAIMDSARRCDVYGDATELVRATLQLRRIGIVRHGLLVALLESREAKWAKRLRGLERYERAALAKRKRALRVNNEPMG